MEKVKEIVEFIVIIIVVFLVKQFIVTPIRVNQSSMNNTLYDKDIMILDKISYRFTDIKRFDIVVIDKDSEYLIKRVIGLPGETVVYEDNKLYINNILVSENFLHKYTSDYTLEEKIPDGYYFVLGDNRPDSVDSRLIGLIKKEEIIGKTKLVIFPFNHFGIKK
ncbi:MAG: signal peptidase I [Bacilli bacterium]|nr:signal peptidase I [Bacilli bacterium]